MRVLFWQLWSVEPEPLPSVWGKTLIFRWLYPRKIVNLSESDGRGLSRDIPISRSGTTSFRSGTTSS
jgi:hypothetical protein